MDVLREEKAGEMGRLVLLVVLFRVGTQHSDDRNQGRKKAGTGATVTWPDVFHPVRNFEYS